MMLLVSLTYAQQQRETVIVRKYTQKDGIDSYNIRRVSQDKYGFIWIATQYGLNRFDGKSFTPYTKNTPPAHRICDVDVRELIADTADDMLWVLPGNTGLNVINTLTGNVVRTIPIPPVNEEDWNLCMTRNGDDLWIGAFTGVKLYRIDRDRFDTLPALKGNPKNQYEFEVCSILRDSNGNMWVAYSGFGIVIYNGHTRAIMAMVPRSQLNDYQRDGYIRFLRSIEPAPGTILFATTEGLRAISYDPHYHLHVDNNPCASWPLLNREQVDDIALRGKEIFAAGHWGLVRLDARLRSCTLLEEHALTTDSRWLKAIQSIYPDTQGHLWLGCQEGVAFIDKQKSPFETFVYDDTTRIKLDHVRAIYPMPDGDILVGLRNGFVRIDGATHRFTLFDPKRTYHHFFRDRKGRVIASYEDGMSIFAHDRLTPIADTYPEFAPYGGVYINSHLFINDTLVVMGTESNSGILLWDPVHHHVRQLMKGSGLFSNIVNNIYRDSRGMYWVLSDNIITLLSPDLRKSQEIRLPFHLYFDMCEAKGYYWIAAYGSGLIQLDKDLVPRRVVNSTGGLANDGVYQLYNLADSQLLATSNNGISLVDLRTFKCANYTSADGLHSDGFEEVSGTRTGGRIFAGGINGFTVIDPAAFTARTDPPHFYFLGVQIQLKGGQMDTSNLRMSSLIIPNTWQRATVRFIGLDYTRPASVHYQYRILERDSVWLDLGGESSLNLIGLTPGTYTLEARAANGDGYWSKPAGLALTFQPKWFETWWFRLAVILAIGSFLYGLYRFRVAALRKQQQIRSGIASDLHDDIGSVLNSVKVFSHLAEKDPAGTEHFRNIDESLTQATIGLRDMIWVLDNSRDTVTELVDRIMKYALPVTVASGIRLNPSYRLPEKSDAITKTEKRNLLLIAKEAINNSIKYSGCRNIMITCTQEKHGLYLCIEDDGKGFDTTLPPMGNGLRNMKERARQIQYRLDISSLPGKGTRIIVSRK